MAGKVAVVTGSNKGIGFAIVKALLKRGIGTVYLTARDTAKGKEAIDKMNKEDLNPDFFQLEVTQKENVKKFAEFLNKKHGGIDILINNAAIVSEHFLKNTLEDSINVISTNYNSILTIQEYIFPILKDQARVVNISSDCGHISNLRNKYWIQRLTKPDLNIQDIEAFIQWYIDGVKNDNLKEEDFNGMNLLAYRISKIAVSALTRIQAREVAGRKIAVNSLHPGLVQTDMTRGKGMLTLDNVAAAPIYLALDIDQSVTGRYFWYDKTEKDWTDPTQEWHVNRPELLKVMKEIDFYGGDGVKV